MPPYLGLNSKFYYNKQGHKETIFGNGNKNTNSILNRSCLYVEIKCQLDTTEVFYWRSYCLLNMFRAPLCPSSGAQEYYTVVAACGISCCCFQVAGLVWS